MQVVMYFLQIIGQVVVVSIDTVWFLAVGLPVLVVYYIVLNIYSRCSRNLQRLESISRSPVCVYYIIRDVFYVLFFIFYFSFFFNN
jgi:hypothetical protein